MGQLACAPCQKRAEDIGEAGFLADEHEPVRLGSLEALDVEPRAQLVRAGDGDVQWRQSGA